ncbi:MAG TPA: IPT/TIG domain-containing protein [Candidatus Dormibacteraeota bacterium]
MLLRRLLQLATAVVATLALTSVPAFAATRKPAPTPRTTPPGQVKKAPTPAAPPLIYQVNPTKVNPTTQPNIMILGQHLTPTSTVEVGGRPATTVQAPDPNHLLVKLPDNLPQGSYQIVVTNDAGTAVADAPLQVDDPGTQFSTLQIAAGAGFLLFLVLVMRLARTPGLS